MANLRDIVSKNNETFYNYNTSVQQTIAPRILGVFLLTLFMSVVFAAVDEALVNAILTVQSILVGFSFSVLFFLLSGAEIRSLSEGSIEQKQKVDKLKKLSEELFYNVSYYNLVAIISVLIALLHLMPSIDRNSAIIQAIYTWLTNAAGSAGTNDWLITIKWWIEFVLRLSLYFLVVESMYTFWRTVRRVSFFFAEKLSLGANVSVAK